RAIASKSAWRPGWTWARKTRITIETSDAVDLTTGSGVLPVPCPARSVADLLRLHAGVQLGGTARCALAREPFGQLEQALGERHRGLVAQHLRGERGVGKAVPHVPHAVVAGDLRPELSPAQSLGQLRRDSADGHAAPAADVEDPA